MSLKLSSVQGGVLNCQSLKEIVLRLQKSFDSNSPRFSSNFPIMERLANFARDSKMLAKSFHKVSDELGMSLVMIF